VREGPQIGSVCEKQFLKRECKLSSETERQEQFQNCQTKRGGIPPLETSFAYARLLNGNRSVIVAMVATGAVQVTTDQVVGMVAVRNAFVAAAGAVLVSLIVGRAIMGRRAGRGIGSAHVHGVIVNMIAMHVVHMTIMQVAIVVAVLDGLVTAVVAVLMIVFAVNFTRHLTSPYPNYLETQLTDN
jgi:hypothetical protein